MKRRRWYNLAFTQRSVQHEPQILVEPVRVMLPFLRYARTLPN
jgi:hypothetical protein